jgi:membrane-associated phospholipid phosphatase
MEPALPLSVALANLLAVAAEAVETVGRFDVLVVARVHDLAPAALIDASLWMANAGSSRSILLITAAALVALAATRSWRPLCALALAVGAEQLVVDVLKGLLERPRPAGADAFSHAAGFSLPSGHSAASAVLFGMLAWAVARHVRPALGVAVLASAFTFIALMGASRVALGVHYPSDVLAGWLTGAAIAAAAWAVTGRIGDGRLAVRT